MKPRGTCASVMNETDLWLIGLITLIAVWVLWWFSGL